MTSVLMSTSPGWLTAQAMHPATWSGLRCRSDGVPPCSFQNGESTIPGTISVTPIRSGTSLRLVFSARAVTPHLAAP